LNSRYAEFRPGFIEAMDGRLYTPEWLDGEIAAGRLLPWYGSDSAILARVERHPTGVLAIHGAYATGDVSEIVEKLIPDAERFALAAGCTTAFIDSREAWQRILGPHGYAPYKIALRKDL
jgi:hypothetical protein